MLILIYNVKLWKSVFIYLHGRFTFKRRLFSYSYQFEWIIYFNCKLSSYFFSFITFYWYQGVILVVNFLSVYYIPVHLTGKLYFSYTRMGRGSDLKMFNFNLGLFSVSHLIDGLKVFIALSRLLQVFWELRRKQTRRVFHIWVLTSPPPGPLHDIGSGLNRNGSFRWYI